MVGWFSLGIFVSSFRCWVGVETSNGPSSIEPLRQLAQSPHLRVHISIREVRLAFRITTFRGAVGWYCAHRQFSTGGVGLSTLSTPLICAAAFRGTVGSASRWGWCLPYEAHTDPAHSRTHDPEGWLIRGGCGAVDWVRTPRWRNPIDGGVR